MRKVLILLPASLRHAAAFGIRLRQKTISPDHPPPPRLRRASGLAVFAIELYQATLSPDHGICSAFFPYGFCRRHPTCSEYAKTALRTEGIFKGTLLTARRLIRCNPWIEPDEERLRRIVRQRIRHT